MIGAIVGDIIGSTRERKKSVFEGERIVEYISNNGRREVLETPEAVIHDQLRFTDDSVLTVATDKALRTGQPFAQVYRRFYHIHAEPRPEMNVFEVGFGENFTTWANAGSEHEPAPPYNSFGNGSAMRVASVGHRANSLLDASALAGLSAACTHSHPFGAIGAVTLANLVFLAKQGKTAAYLKDYVKSVGDYQIDFDERDLVAGYQFNPTCQGSLPHAIWAALKGPDFTSVMERCLRVGGDTDTICAMAGAIAEPLWGVPEEYKQMALTIIERDGPFLYDELLIALNDGPYPDIHAPLSKVEPAGRLSGSILNRLNRLLTKSS